MPVRICVTESSLTYLDCLLVELSKGVQGIQSGFPTLPLELPWAQCLQCRCVSLMSKFCFLHHIYTVVSTFLSLSSHTLSAFIEDSSSTLLVRECLEFKELYCYNFTSIPLDRCWVPNHQGHQWCSPITSRPNFRICDKNGGWSRVVKAMGFLSALRP